MTMTTVGYGDVYPRTDVGRGVGVALMLIGVGLFGVIAANLAALFVGEREDAVLVELRALRDQVASLELQVRGTTEATTIDLDRSDCDQDARGNHNAAWESSARSHHEH